MNVNIGNCFDNGIEKFKQNIAFYVVGFLVIVIISTGLHIISLFLNYLWTFIIGTNGPKIYLSGTEINIIATGGGCIAASLLMLLILPLVVGYWKGIKKEYAGGTAEITDIFSAFDITIPCLLNCALANLIITVEVISCIIPIILLSFLIHIPIFFLILGICLFGAIPLILLTPFSYLPIFFLAKGETQGLNALKRSWETLKKNPILILWTIVLGIFAALGLLACCVGIFATAPIAMCATYKLFQQAIGEDNLPPVEPVQTDENAPIPS